MKVKGFLSHLHRELDIQPSFLESASIVYDDILTRFIAPETNQTPCIDVLLKRLAQKIAFELQTQGVETLVLPHTFDIHSCITARVAHLARRDDLNVFDLDHQLNIICMDVIEQYSLKD